MGCLGHVRFKTIVGYSGTVVGCSGTVVGYMSMEVTNVGQCYLVESS